MKIFCFPWSGGSSSFFFRYTKVLEEGLEIIPIDPVFDEDISFKQVIDQVADLIFQQSENERIILFGHSMGAVLAFEAAKKMEEKLGTGKIGLVISGMLPPSRERFEKLDSSLNREKAKRYSLELGMAELEMLPDTFLDMVIHKMNNDNLLLKRYESCREESFHGPAAVIYSEQEQKLGEPEEWAEHFSENVEYCRVKGEHFYLVNDFEYVGRVINSIRIKLEERIWI